MIPLPLSMPCSVRLLYKKAEPLPVVWCSFTTLSSTVNHRHLRVTFGHRSSTFDFKVTLFISIVLSLAETEIARMNNCLRRSLP
eukprot:scaffold23443_cov105-Skeletonema_marinoi.AAC.2